MGRLPHREIGGVPIYTQSLAKAVAETGSHVDVVFPGPASASADAFGEIPCEEVADVPRWLGLRAKRFAEGFALANAAAQAVASNSHDVVNVQYGGAMDLAIVHRMLATPAKVLVTAHCGPSWWHLRRTPALACRLLARAHAVLTLSQDQRDLFAAHGVPAHRLADAPALIESAFFAPAANARRSSEGMYLGRIAPGKGMETLLRALARCTARPTIRLVGPSADAYRLQLMRLAGRLGVDDAVRWYPAVRTAAERRRLLGECRFLVHPTQQDVRPLALIEAMACGVPILASALPGTLELLAGHGSTFPVGDAVALARRLDEAARLSPTPAQLEHGMSLAASYHPRQAAAKFLAICNSVLERDVLGAGGR